MKISYSWIKEYVDIKITPEKLEEKLSMAGLSVASLEKAGDDWVYDIEVTSNRPDWLSVRGIVREVAAITNSKLVSSPVHRFTGLKNKKINGQTGKRANRLNISIEDTKGCTLYYGNLICGVKVGPSPRWLQKKLEAVGLRSINNVVDITNFCLMEYGQPLHAFDHDKLGEGAIVVRRARGGESLVLIDGSDKKLAPEVLVIADGKKPVAIAGIMGGRDTEVSEKTTTVMLESACFDPVVVRRGTRALGVASDSSYRFERGVDVAIVKTALEAATEMIESLCSGALAERKQAGSAKEALRRKVIFRLQNARDILSIPVTLKEARDILEKLGFGVRQKSKDTLEVTVPGFRRDIKIEQDLTEEIARAYGYEKIPLTIPEIKAFSIEPDRMQKLEKTVKDLLVAMGLKETVTYSLIADESYSKSGLERPQDPLALKNPLSSDYRILRTTLVPSLLECAAFNINHNNPDLEIFEIAHVFDKRSERLSLGILLSGAKRSSWGKEAKDYTFFDLKGILEVLFGELRVEGYRLESSTKNWLECCIKSGEDTLACLAKVPETVKRNYGIKSKEDVFVAELSLDILAGRANFTKVFKPLSSIPSISRDISVLAADAVSFETIKGLIEKNTLGYLKRIRLLECYQGKEIPAGHKGLTISLEYGSETKTLTDAQINPVHENVLEALVKELSLTLR